jgi:hypothetical protein
MIPSIMLPRHGPERFEVPPTFPELTAVITARQPSTRFPLLNPTVPNKLTVSGTWDGASLRAHAVYPTGVDGEWLRVPLTLSADQPSAALPPATFGIYLDLRRPSALTRLEATVECDEAAMQSLTADLEARAAHPAVRERMRQAMNGQSRRVTPRNITRAA